MRFLERTPHPWPVARDDGDHAPSRERLPGGLGAALPTSVGAFAPALDLEESEDAYTIYAELPGVAPDDLDVSVEGELVTIAGERRFYDEERADRFRRVERHFGRFHRTVRLPEGSDPDGIDATHHDGVLTIRIPKREDSRRQRIAVRAAS